ncbi:protein tyrosine phosphatase mitochondrial 1 [Cricetulus griseus]
MLEKHCLPGAGIWGTPRGGHQEHVGRQGQGRGISGRQLGSRTADPKRRTWVPCRNQALGAWRVKAKGMGAGARPRGGRVSLGAGARAGRTRKGPEFRAVRGLVPGVRGTGSDRARRALVRGWAHRDWYHRIDSTVLLGALPLRSMTRRLVLDENVRGVITMNEEYETRFLCNTAKEWKQAGVEQLRLSTVDMTGVPTLANLHRGVQFALKYQSMGQCVYVHCKAGRSRSATMVAAYLIQVHNWSPEEAIEAIAKIRTHISIRPNQLQVLKEFHKEITARAAKNTDN